MADSRDGAPDHSAATFTTRYKDYLELRDQLDAIGSSSWPVAQQVDWHIVPAEMNGFDFIHRVLKPWVRDPALHLSIWMGRSDVPAQEGPTHHAVTEFWTYSLPLSDSEEKRLVSDLKVIPPLMQQARENLTGNAKVLWIAGIKNIKDQQT